MSNFNNENEILNIDLSKDTSEEDLFKIGGFVMHPIYGIGHVENIEERRVETELYNFEPRRLPRLHYLPSENSYVFNVGIHFFFFFIIVSFDCVTNIITQLN